MATEAASYSHYGAWWNKESVLSFLFLITKITAPGHDTQNINNGLASGFTKSSKN